MNIKEVGCWIIQYVNRSQPWLGTHKAPWKAHTMQPYMAGMRCSTCGVVIGQDGVIVSQVTPDLTPPREPTAAELAAHEASSTTDKKDVGLL